MDDLERGEDVKSLTEDGCYILWDGTRHGWIRCRDAPILEDWR